MFKSPNYREVFQKLKYTTGQLFLIISASLRENDM